MNWRILFGVIIFFLALPVLIPYAAISHHFYLRRLRAAANKTVCSNCGKILGDEALRLADVYCANDLAESQKEKPGIRQRRVRRVHAICAHCHAHWCFHENSGIFTRVDDETA
ncbi:MAG: hypothetical protein LBE21_06405 [Pseudomonadales bacterium]|jgi:hypothetical protein|nr:hypothetical protein [Pseudomonadales bacterium]